MKILLAIDGSQASREAVRFISEMLAGSRVQASVTLYHVIETLPEYLLSRGRDAVAGAAYRQLIDDLTSSRKAEGERLLAEHRQALVSAGLPATALHCKLEIRDALPEARKVAAAMAVIEEMKSGDYSVVCLGRRGTASAEGSFLGSVAEKVLREARGRTVWVVDR